MASGREDSPSESASNDTSDERMLMSRTEREDAARILGVPEEEIVQHSFRVSRQRLEELMFAQSGNLASNFFGSIMRDTGTVIDWPTRLRLNARSRRDPFVKVRGTPDNVDAARLKIEKELIALGVSNVTLKIDLSYTDHSRIIGRKGISIKEVMNDTGCHIHFPDRNRCNEHDKSNVVSISGDIVNVETARSKVRDMVALVFSFDWPGNPSLSISMEERSPFVTALQEQYNVQVVFRTKRTLNSMVVQVRGNSTDYENVKEATEKMLRHIRAPQIVNVEQVQVSTTIEISPQHHCTIRGNNNENLNTIMKVTGTQITFPDLFNPMISPLNKSKVIIVGNGIRNVYLALQLVIGSLPVVMTFEAPEQTIETGTLCDISSRHAVHFSSSKKRKMRSTVYTVTLKGLERNIGSLYAAYKEMVPSNQSNTVKVRIPSTYHLPEPSSKQTFNLDSLNEVQAPLRSAVLPPSPPTLAMASQMPTKSYFPQMETPARCSHQNFHPYSLWAHPYLPLNNNVAESRLTNYPHSSSSLSDVTAHSLSSSNTCGHSPTPSTSTSQNSPKENRDINNRVNKRPLSPVCDSLSYSGVKAVAIEMRRKQPRPSELRIPTPVWAGFGLSHSSPSPPRSVDGNVVSDDGQVCEDSTTNVRDERGSTESLVLSNIFEGVGNSFKSRIRNIPTTFDLNYLLASIGLDKYYSNFLVHEATEMPVFTSLTEHELIEMGITVVGARKKLMMLIAEWNRRKNSNFRLTPGAEQKIRPVWPQQDRENSS